MKIKFNKFERVAGLFVLTALIGSLAAALGIAAKKGWFSSKVPFETVMKSADGIHAGTVVQIAGLRVGSVSDVELMSAEKIRVKFEVFEKFHTQIRKDSVVQVFRPFIIGDKVLEVSVGSQDQELLASGEYIQLKESFDIMDVVSGKKMGPFVETVEKLTSSMKSLGEAFMDPERTKALVKMFDRLAPLLANVNDMAVGMVKITDTVLRQKRLETLVTNLNEVTDGLVQLIPPLVKESPDAGVQLGQMVRNLNILTQEMQKLTPAISAVAPELPKTSLKAVEALNETVVLLKALQKSFFLKGSVEAVKEEERRPASSSP